MTSNFKKKLTDEMSSGYLAELGALYLSLFLIIPTIFLEKAKDFE